MTVDINVLTLTIATLVAIITFGQWQTARLNLKQQLFEKRYEVYEKITGFVAEIQISGGVKDGSDIEFLRETKRAYFLFAGDNDVKNLVSEIFKNATRLHTLDAELKGVVGAARKQNIDKQREIKTFMEDTLRTMESRFEKYLKLNH